MFYIFLTIILIAIGLFIASFFMNDRIKEIEDQLEQFSISTMQDTYQIKKKLKVLEEELLTNEPIVVKKEAEREHVDDLENQPLLVQKIHHLHEQGFSVDDIAKETNLSNHDVNMILKHQL